MHLREILPGTIAAARAAGRLIRRAFHQKRSYAAKGPRDFVTSVDTRSEELLRQELSNVIPEAEFWGEESGGNSASTGLRWVVDPLDGTTNFLHSYPHSAISLALTRGSELLLAVVHDPYRQETFQAVRGQGAWLGKRRLHVSNAARLEDSLLATNFADHPPAQFELFQRFQGRARGIRCDSCASLDLAYVAAGRFSAFWEVDLKPWDVAAGILLVTEAGGQVTDLGGAAADWRLASGNYLVTNGLLQQEMLEELADVRAGLEK